jgi:hypothetical protein
VRVVHVGANGLIHLVYREVELLDEGVHCKGGASFSEAQKASVF